MTQSSLDLDTERKLIKKSQKDKRAFGKLYEHYLPLIERFFRIRIQTDSAKIEDLTSQVFEKALAGLDSFQWQGVSFSAWLYKIAKNTLVDEWRSQKRTVPLEKIGEPQSKKPGPEEALFQKEDGDLLRELLRKLPERERKIIYLKFFDGYTNKAISKMTGLSETNIGTIIYRTVRKLRKAIK